jgi:predicted Rossmann-fold nucleotide-binding protein
MMCARVRKVLAVFGGNKMKSETERQYQQRLQIAERFGFAIADRGPILLTGGIEPGLSPIKNRAIYGALEKSVASLWIGVDRIDERKEPTVQIPEIRHHGLGGFVIRSTLDHQRNALEAYLADAAICLMGGSGTVSEMTFSLSLGRPVALVGDEWPGTYDVKAAEGLAKAIQETHNRLRKAHGKHKLDPSLYDESALRNRLTERLSVPESVKYFGSESSAEEVLDWAAAESTAPNLPGSFPDIPQHRAVKDQYEEWINLHGTDH